MSAPVIQLRLHQRQRLGLDSVCTGWLADLDRSRSLLCRTSCPFPTKRSLFAQWRRGLRRAMLLSGATSAVVTYASAPSPKRRPRMNVTAVSSLGHRAGYSRLSRTDDPMPAAGGLPAVGLAIETGLACRRLSRKTDTSPTRDLGAERSKN